MKMQLDFSNESKNKYKISENAAISPGPGEVSVKIEASSINYHDWAVVTGVKKTRDGLVPLTDGAGRVEAVGEGVTEFAPGDFVMSRFFPNWIAGAPTVAALSGVPGDQVDGFACTHITLPATAFTRAPAHLSAVEAAALPCAALTAWRALFVEGSVGPGSWVVTQGTGGVSLFALQFARMAGARVIATSSSQAKLERLRELGAHHVVNYREQPKWFREVMDVTGGVGADQIIEVGGGDTLAQSLRACRIGGRIAVIGVLSGHTSELFLDGLLGRNITLAGLSVGNREHQADMVRGMEANAMRPIVDRVFPLADLSEAVSYYESGAHFGKVCLDHGA